MPQHNRRPDPAINDDLGREQGEEMGAAGHETGLDEPSATGTAGVYATPVHEEAEEAEAEGQRRSTHAPR
jgi:hypothetical protein